MECEREPGSAPKEPTEEKKKSGGKTGNQKYQVVQVSTCLSIN